MVFVEVAPRISGLGIERRHFPLRQRDADGDGVQNNGVVYTHVLNRGPHGVVSPADAI